MLDVLVDALIDTVKLLPFLFVTYLLMEWLEHKTSSRTKGTIRKAGKLGPVVGGLLGAVPQCGFSAAASNLYAGKVITVGTLIAIFLSTSDEMLPIMISEHVPVQLLLTILATKVVIGIAAGFLVDFVVSRKKTVEKIEVGIHQVCEHDHCHCEKSIVKSALKHTVVIEAFILIISVVLNTVIFFVGEDTIATLILDRPVLGPVVAGIVGLIPNCAASVVITQLYLENLISYGSMMAGLLAGAGVGILVMFRVNGNLKDNVKIAGTVYGIGVICGIIMDFIC